MPLIGLNGRDYLKHKGCRSLLKDKLAHINAVIASCVLILVKKMGQNLKNLMYSKEKCIKYYLERYSCILNEHFLHVYLC